RTLVLLLLFRSHRISCDRGDTFSLNVRKGRPAESNSQVGKHVSFVVFASEASALFGHSREKLTVSTRCNTNKWFEPNLRLCPFLHDLNSDRIVVQLYCQTLRVRLDINDPGNACSHNVFRAVMTRERCSEKC